MEELLKRFSTAVRNTSSESKPAGSYNGGALHGLTKRTLLKTFGFICGLSVTAMTIGGGAGRPLRAA